jgi:hypothetical protein
MPLLAKIIDTSPLVTIPVPICAASLLENLHSFAPNAHPIIFEKTAAANNKTVNKTISALNSCSTILMPILAKNTGERSM